MASSLAAAAQWISRGRKSVLIIAFAILATSSSVSEAFSLLPGPARRCTIPPTSLSMSAPPPKPRGCASKPYEKKKIAVFGAGGYLGATIFGFLQRASSLYGTGIAGVSSPRSICATAAASASLNKVLSKNFRLAYAGEDLVRLTNMKDVESIRRRLDGFDAAVLGTVYQLAKKPVTGNTYETSPNDKTYEFYLDCERRSGGSDPSEGENDVEETHLELFRNALRGCKDAGLKHVIVIETPRTSFDSAKSFAKELDGAGLPFTYLRCNGELVTTPDYTYYKGLVGEDLDLQSFTLAGGYASASGYKAGDWMEALADVRVGGGGGGGVGPNNELAREDVAALAVQSLMSLDWTKARYLQVEARGDPTDTRGGDSDATNSARPDKDWCANSEVLASKLAPVE